MENKEHMNYREFLIKALNNKKSDEYKHLNEIRKKIYGLIECNEQESQALKKYFNNFYESETKLFNENYSVELPPSKINFKNLLINCNINAVHEVQTYLSEFDGEFLIFDLYDKLLTSDSNVVDVGANTGVHTCVLSKICERGTVHSIEPDQNNIKNLKNNLKLNNLTNNINIIKEALHSEIKEVYFDYHSNNFNKGVGQISNNYTNNKIITNTLDNLNIKEKIDLIKIDVEGYEVEVLKGGKELLIKNKPHIIIEYNPNSWSLKMLNDFIPYDFKLYIIPNTKREELTLINTNTQIPANRFTNLLIKPNIFK